MRDYLKNSNQYLKSIYLKRKANNSHYSLSAFARDLDISQPYLSMIFANKRTVNFKMAVIFADKLKLEVETRENFFESCYSSHFSTIKKYDERDLLQILSLWYHVAILDMIAIKSIPQSHSGYAKLLGITQLEVEDAIERLKLHGLINETKNGLEKTNKRISFPTQKSHASVRSYHRSMIEKAKNELKKTEDSDFEKRCIVGTTLSIKKENLGVAKILIKKFQSEIGELLTNGEPDDLYQINIQLFPLINKDL